MREHFQNDLGLIREQISALGARVLNNIDLALQAILENDKEKARAVLHSEDAVDSSEVRIEGKCLKVIALNQPVADDLRFLITVIRINHDLERISDQAARIAKTVLRIPLFEITSYKESFERMGSLVHEMIGNSLEALLEKDTEKARRIWQRDQKIDDLRDELTLRLRSDIMNRNVECGELFEFLNIVNRFERAADHAANIAKAVFYLVLGKVVRHRNLELLANMPDEKIRVLFVCVHNSARSQMAATWLNQLYGERYKAESAGLSPGTLNPLAIKVMQECGIDISQNQVRDVFSVVEQGSHFDFVITVCDLTNAERCPPFLGIADREAWEFDDPSRFTGTDQERIEKMRSVRDAIRRRIENWVVSKDEVIS